MYIGIDPGLKGGIALLNSLGCLIDVLDMPTEQLINGKDGIDIQRLHAVLDWQSATVAIEQVQAMPPTRLPNGQSINMNVSMFNFGKGYGIVKAVATICTRNVLDVTPQKWKKYFNLIGKDKKASVAKALEIYPDAKDQLITKRGRLIDGRADALLLARYAYETIRD